MKDVLYRSAKIPAKAGLPSAAGYDLAGGKRGA